MGKLWEMSLLLQKVNNLILYLPVMSFASCFGNILYPDQARGYKTFFMLNSTEHEISTAHKKLKYQQIKKSFASSLSDVGFIMLMNVIYEHDRFHAQLS